MSFYSQAQFEKSLLWEISGNGLTKKSYIYGTYHVNEKISYHLTDEFYQHLLQADIVSNESSPDSWGDLFDFYIGNEQMRNADFYEDFSIKPITKQELVSLFMNYNFFNQMSSGVEGNRADYSENTVLDMFIFQTAKKYNKKTVGLENAKKSFVNILKSETQQPLLNFEEEENTEEEELKKAQLSKILKGKTIYNSLKDFYREKDIVMLDSLSKLSDKPKKHKIMIIDRNYIMAKSIDSLVRQGSLFSAVGAAHLSGKEGVLQLLINKGYKVSPVMGKLTKKGENDKKTIEEYFPSPKIKTEITNDKMIQSVGFDLDFQYDRLKSTLDITNGGVLTTNRIPLRNYLKKKSDSFNPKSIDSLFYEFIPGVILEKTEIKDESFVGYDIKSKSKTGNHQHYRFYVTPLEIISVSYIGSGNYVKQYEQNIYNQLKIKGFKKTWERISPEKGGFSINMPEFCVQYGNNAKTMSDISFEAYDPEEKSYFFVIEKTSTDIKFFDERSFQHQQIQNEFYLGQEMKETAKFDHTTKEFRSKSVKDDRNIELKSVVSGNKFYLLGAVDASEENSKKFFDSFKKEPFNSAETTVYRDTLRKFEIEIPKKINEKTILGIDRKSMRTPYRFQMHGETNLEPIEFVSHSGQIITVEVQDYPRYLRETSMDSIKNNYNNGLKVYYDTFRPKTMVVDPFVSTWNSYFKVYEKTEILKNTYTNNKDLDCDVSEALISSKNSDQALKVKTFLMNNRKAIIKTIVDRNYQNDDAFIEKAFNEFKPEKTNAKSVLDDKVNLFLEEASSEKDSIRKIAFFNLYNLSLEETDFDRITNFIDNHQFKDTDLSGKVDLYKKLGELKNPKVTTYLETKYKDENTKTTEQLAILTALANQNTKASYQLVLKLMEFDLPITEDNIEIVELFDNFIENSAESKVLFPEIFQFYGIKEYDDNIIRFCNELVNKDLGSPKKIAAFQKLILTHTKLEYKRLLNREEKKASNDYEDYETAAVDEYYDDESNPNASLVNYLSLLHQLPKNKNADELISKIKKLDNAEIQLEILKLEINHNKATKEGIKKALDNPKTKFRTVLLLQGNDDFDFLEELNNDEIAESAMYHFDRLKESSKIQFLEKREMKKEKHDIVFYFYQTQNTKDGKNIGGKVFNSIVFITENGKIIPKAFFSPYVADIDEENTVEKLKEIIIKETLYSDHPGANFRKNNRFNNFYDYYQP